MSEDQIQSITVDPPALRWGELVERGQAERLGVEVLGRPLREWVTISRIELLGEAVGGQAVVLGTGHQAGFWHPGILAKYLALGAAGAMLGRDGPIADQVGLLELVVDQDVHDALTMRVPVTNDDGGEGADVLRRLGARPVVLSLADESEETPLGLRPIAAARLPALAGVEQAVVAGGLRKMVEGLEEAKGTAANLAEQLTIANAALRDEVFGESGLPRTILFATKLVKSSIWSALLTAMRDDPRRVAESYNDAVLENPGSGMALLRVTEDEIELPLWKITDGRNRARAFADDLLSDGGEGVVFWPRALLMTGLVRLVLVDLFIHGLGGQRYDRVTEAWLREWLGVELAPLVTVSADVYLDFGLVPASTRDVSAARWEWHHLQYNLDRVMAEAWDEPGLLAEKREVLAKIDAAPRRSAERYAAYLELQAINERWRVEHAAVLEEARLEILKRERAVAERGILEDRTWAFPLYGREVLRALQREIAAQFGVAGEGDDDGEAVCAVMVRGEAEVCGVS